MSGQLQKLSTYLEQHQIDLTTFWQSTRNYASYEEILGFSKTVGLQFEINEKIRLKESLFQDREVLSIHALWETIEYWRQQGTDMLQTFMNRKKNFEGTGAMSVGMGGNLSGKGKTSFSKKGFSTTVNASFGSMSKSKILSQGNLKPPFGSRPQSVGPRAQSQKHRPLSSGYRQGAISQTGNNSSQKYLSQYKQRQMSNERMLVETIDKTKEEYQYEMLLKMAELNSYNQEKELPESYRAYKSAEGTIKVRVFMDNKFQREITLKQLQHIYRGYRKKVLETKEWTVGARSTSLNQSGAFSSHTSQHASPAHSSVHKPPGQADKFKKAQRQQELQNLLQNTINLTNLLKEQIKIFKEKGIYGCEGL